VKTEAKTQQRRRYTPEFKAGAVALVLSGGRRVADVARDLRVHKTVVGHWVRQARIDAGDGPPTALTSWERDELAQLRKENRKLKVERDILKKAAAFFAKESA
jgi:transposase